MTSKQPTPDDYERLPYEGHPDPLIHPERMACVAELFGVEAPAIKGARILEIGCATGAHLIPMAYQLPEASFLGFDYAPGQIATATATAGTLGLKNIHFEVRDLRDSASSLGEYDYIIAHGVFSWIPADLQDQLLKLCRERLTPRGIALVDYNVYPGWHLRNIYRDLMQFQGTPHEDPMRSVSESLDLLDFIGNHLFVPAGPYGQTINSLKQWSRPQSRNYLAHEFGAAVNSPILFTDFASRAHGFGLEILGDAQILHGVPKHLAASVAAKLKELAGNDYARSEQVMDFLRGRDFRRTLLVRQGVAMTREPRLEAMRHFHLSTMAQEQPMATGVFFRCPDGTGLQSTDPRSIALMRRLCQAGPEGLGFSALISDLHRNAPEDPSSAHDQNACAELLLEFAAVGLVQLHMHPPRLLGRVSAKPIANAMARMDAAMNHETATGMLQRDWQIDAFDRLLLPLLDGTREIDAIVSGLTMLAAAAKPATGGTPDEANPAEMCRAIRAKVEASLAWYARAGFLIG